MEKSNFTVRLLKKAVDKAGWNEGYAYAKYVPPTEGYEATFSDFENGIKGDYPYQVLCIHDLRGTHTVFNQVTWLREAFSYELEVNSIDAREKGFKEGMLLKSLTPAEVSCVSYTFLSVLCQGLS